MPESPPMPRFTCLAVMLRGRGSAGASIWLSWKSPCPLMCTSLSARSGRPRTYPETQSVPRPLAASPTLLAVNVTCCAKRWGRLERKPSFLCLWLPRCLRRRVPSCSESRGKRRASGKRFSVILDSALLASTLFFTGRSVTPWHTRAAIQRQRREVDRRWSWKTANQSAWWRGFRWMLYTHRDWAGPAQRGRRGSSRRNCPNLQWRPEQKPDYLQPSQHPGGSASRLLKKINHQRQGQTRPGQNNGEDAGKESVLETLILQILTFCTCKEQKCNKGRKRGKVISIAKHRKLQLTTLTNLI